MRILFILLLALITLQVNAQTKIIGSTTTAGGDLELTYPNPRIKNNIINRNKLTQGLRDSLTRFRKDTFILKNTDGQLSLSSTPITNALGKYSRVNIMIFGNTGWTQSVVLPFGADTLKNTEFNITHYSQDTLAEAQIANFNGFILAYSPPSIVSDLYLINLKHSRTLTTRPLYINSNWVWSSQMTKDIFRLIVDGDAGSSAGITALTGDGTATGPGSAVFTIGNSKITTPKILDANVTLAKMAPNSVNSSKIVDASVALADMATNSVDNTKIVDYSITGTDLNYLTLRAGDATNPLIRWSAGAVLTTPVAGTWEWDANKLNFTVGSTRKRIPLFNEGAPSSGSLLIGNGTDFTNAALTAGYAQTVTNGSGSITINPDTTKVIPFIPSGEIANGTRDGYFKTQTSFGHQFYNGVFRIFNSSLATTSGSTQLYVSNGTNDVGHLLIVSSTGASFSQTYVNNGANGKSTTLDYKGLTTQVYYTSVSANNQAVTTYQIDGQNGIERITDGTVTTVVLPEIVGNPSTNQVGIGFKLHLTINSPTSVTISRAGSDTIEVHGAAAAANSVPANTGAIYSKTYVATDSNTWTVY